MFKKRIKELKEELRARTLDLETLNDAPADAVMTDWYKDAVMKDISRIETEIHHEENMLIFKYTILFAAIASALILFCTITKKYL
jgi:hypothetical protein